MDPMNREPEEYGHEQGGDDHDGSARPQRPRDPLTPDFGQHTPALARTVRLVSGDFLLTVNPVDGSEIEPCPPGERPERPARRTADERAELRRAAMPPVPPGPALPRLPLLERQEERERLVRLLARGRSVRLTGPAGSGRTALLNAVADDCADLAPDGVVRLSGYRRTPGELLQDLFATVYAAPSFRPDRALLLELLNDIGAVVVLDDLEFGGAGLDEVLDATPECAFLISTTPDTAAPSADSHLEEVFLGGLGRGGSLELLERVVGRVLDDEEANWPATSGSSPRACRCASSRRAPCSASATSSAPTRTPSRSTATSPTPRSTRPSTPTTAPTRRCPRSPTAPRPRPCSPPG
ncbi:hypothetical protein SALBM135S_03804 [Streptomyces alboniger]